mgnify:CR=1 FL=1
MKDCIDIYSRLLIATITFVVPIIINLLSTFRDNEKARIEKTKLKEEEVGKKLLTEINNNPGNLIDIVNETHQEYKNTKRETESELNRLNPLKQFWNIFICLTISMFFLLLYHLTKENNWNLHAYLSCKCIMILSGIFYIVALYFIIRILYTISNAKKAVNN